MKVKKEGIGWGGWWIVVGAVMFVVFAEALEWKEKKRRSEERQKALAMLEEKCKAVNSMAEENMRLCEKLWSKMKEVNANIGPGGKVLKVEGK